MSDEKPLKLYTSKPKKARVKQFQEKHKVRDASSSSAAPLASSNMGSASPPAPPAPPAPPKPPSESFPRRYKFLWPMLLTVNLAVGAYLFMRTKKQDEHVAEEEAGPVVEARPLAIVVVEPMKVREPIPLAQQRELFKWILEEKHKIKPKDREEKKRIEEEKAILKEFIQAKSFPNV